jgi:hypothetical protein
MKKLLLIVAGLIAASALTVNAQDATPKTKKAAPTAEGKQVKKEMLEKYDTNKNGKLDKEEKAKITPEDKEKMEKAGMTTPKKKKAA